MSFPGRNYAVHLFWKTVGRFPVVRVWLTRLFVPSRDMDLQPFGASLRINSREEIGLARTLARSDNEAPPYSLLAIHQSRLSAI